jgi:alpha-N-acetylglucosaminidase
MPRMRKVTAVIVVLLFSTLAIAADISPSPSPAAAAHNVLQRVIGQRADEFTFESIPQADSGEDVYEAKASGGKVTVRGNSAVSMCRGAYDYLRAKCHCMFGWEGENMDLPTKLPDMGKHRVVSPYALRQDYNVCTFGYTTAYWGWDQWQHEIDWMALHGINMPLAEVATEAIWQRVWLDMGIKQSELDQYFTGPAFLAWHRMGNINRWNGPFPTSFYPKQIELQKKIVGRMRELGMMPIAPAFAGFVPPALARVHPEAKITELAAWGKFDDQYRTYLLGPTSPLYREIGRRFIQEWEKEFGENKYFLADSFNEMKVPVPPDRAGRLALLAQYGDAVYQSIVAGEPKATWVMQGWLFYNQASFWDKGSVAALLSKVPNDRMIVLDLANDFRPIWSSHDAFYGKQWIFSVIHNMGGKTTVGGDLKFFATDAARTLAAPNHGRLVGFGLAPEGIENNEVVYELLTDAMWTSKAIDLDKWLPAYCKSRYGACPSSMKQAWQLLCKSAYAKSVSVARPRYVLRPGTGVGRWTNRPDASPEYGQGLKLFLKSSPQLGSNALYRADAMDMTAQYLGLRIDTLVASALAAHTANDQATCDRSETEALDLMNDVDSLLANHPINRLDRWAGFARAWGDTPAESDYYEADAKRQITTWGGPILAEYACKIWNGLVGTYYRGRWAGTFGEWATGQKFDVEAWEENWIRTPSHFPKQTTEDSIQQCQQLIAKADSEK